MTTSVAVVVPCRNEAGTIGQLLDAIVRQTRRPDDVIIVDDGSTVGTAEAVASWRRAHSAVRIRVIRGPCRGVAAAVNAGITASTSDVIVRLDGHSVPAPTYVDFSLQALSDSAAGVAGGVWRVEPGAPTVVARAIANVVSHPLGSGGARYRDASRRDAGISASVDTVPFGAFRRDLWTRLGGYDETLIANEDYDFNYRARRAGVAVVLDPRIESQYFARPTLGALGRQYHRYGFWKAQMLRKDPKALRWRQVPPALVLPWLVASSVVAVAMPPPMGLAAAAAYPAIIAAAAAHIAYRAKVAALWPAACAALAVVHVAWSAGFLRAAVGISAPSSASR